MKRIKVLYWIFTGLASLAFLASGIMYFSGDPAIDEGFKQMGYPVFFKSILGVAKILGALALVNPWSNTLKEWAYAGFSFTLIGATITHLATSTPFIAPLIFLALLASSYFLFSRFKSNNGLITNKIA